eukprot:CAMPEP_0194346476 /NCGR_PEP_ID=MMETSP0171-20130528/105447_1 /TAXON_ID=218684 /ORGANISM="Corethron pennatum, Strain L29A3" /LENGTH=663 /DNA_ID=CAMNT_0039113607 /DNA_START=543 /DNA_END=2534 /DNA_ORIENTATION=-
MCGQSRPNNESHISSRTVSRYLLDITIAQITKECVVAHRQGAANLVSPLMEQMRKLKGKLNDYPTKDELRTGISKYDIDVKEATNNGDYDGASYAHAKLRELQEKLKVEVEAEMLERSKAMAKNGQTNPSYQAEPSFKTSTKPKSIERSVGEVYDDELERKIVSLDEKINAAVAESDYGEAVELQGKRDELIKNRRASNGQGPSDDSPNTSLTVAQFNRGPAASCVGQGERGGQGDFGSRKTQSMRNVRNTPGPSQNYGFSSQAPHSIQDQYSQEQNRNSMPPQLYAAYGESGDATEQALHSIQDQYSQEQNRNSMPPQLYAAHGESGDATEQALRAVQSASPTSMKQYDLFEHASNPNEKEDGGTFEILISKDDFKFHAAHFIAYAGYREKIHGHNYTADVRLTGRQRPSNGNIEGMPLDRNLVRSVVKMVCEEINEHMIVPTISDVLHIEDEGSEDEQGDNLDKKNVKITCEDGTFFSFPRDDCLLLPIAHSTTEELGVYLWARLVEAMGLTALLDRGIHTLEVSLAESPGQEASFRKRLPDVEDENECNLFDLVGYVSDYLGRVSEVPPRLCFSDNMPPKIGRRKDRHDQGCNCREDLSRKLSVIAGMVNRGELQMGDNITGEDLERIVHHHDCVVDGSTLKNEFCEEFSKTGGGNEGDE